MRITWIPSGEWSDLGLAILIQAIEDSKSSNGIAVEARGFLKSSGCKWLLSLIDISDRAWSKVLKVVGEGDYQLGLEI